MAPLDLYLLTFNCARNFVNPATLAPCFFDALPPNAPLPGLIAISLQEVAPIAYSFLGGSYLRPYFDQVHKAVQLALRIHGDNSEEYKHVITETLGLTALVLFAKADVADRMQWIQTAGTGVGLWEMGNKGAVGIRIGITQEGSSEQSKITFIAAHLAPMEDAVQRRNEDWENIARTLVFVDNGKSKSSRGEEEPLLSTSSDTHISGYSGIYVPGSHIFLAGDLNYRTSKTPPGPNDYQDYPQPQKSDTHPKHFSYLLEDDQLTEELNARRTLQGFEELPITFPPTYKYSFKRESSKSTQPRSDEVDGTEGEDSWKWAKHRYPSWCDRILFLRPPSPYPKLRTHKYTSLLLQPTSDHQPVALSVTVPLEVPEHVEDADLLPSNCPTSIDKDWKERRAAARRKEILVGLMAYLGLTREGNVVLLALTGGVIAGWYILQTVL